jgi:PTS system mannose-specific IIB component
MVEAGIEIPKIDLGIIFNEDGRTPLTKFIALNDQERADLKILAAKGIPITIQYVPTDPEEQYQG